MKKSKVCKVLVSAILLFAITVSVAGCATTIQASDLMEGIRPNAVSAMTDLSEGSSEAIDFFLRLFAESNLDGQNTLVSPLSVMCALAMTANGADGETRAQMESVLGMSIEELNLFLYSYLNNLPNGDKYKLNVANSIWFTDDESFTVNQDFLQTNADYYGASLYKTPFEEQTVKDINTWVNDKTDEMIPEILSNLSSDAIMYLINALAFEAEWSKAYEDSQIRGGIFTKEDGTEQEADMMYSSEGEYLENENTTGFLKYYAEGKYAFVALLPKEGIKLSDYVQSLNSASLQALLANKETVKVNAAIPKFEAEYEGEMSSVLKTMGMTHAFNGQMADFSKLGAYSGHNIYISQVIHKTYIQVGEKGTRAGAATVVQINKTSLERPDESKQVYLDRPFVYMILDCENNLPFFIGTMTGLK